MGQSRCDGGDRGRLRVFLEELCVRILDSERAFSELISIICNDIFDIYE